jgi:hypothetical protein
MSNEFSRLPPKPGQMQINQKQGSLALEIDKQTEIQGIGMGVLKDGTPFLNQRGLARLCGIENAHIGTISSQWNDVEQKPRIRAIKDLLSSRGITVESPHLVLTVEGKPMYAYPDKVSLAILEYYAFEAGSNFKEEARKNFRILAGSALQDFIYTQTGYDPAQQIPAAWQLFHDRVSLVYDSVPAGHFSIFKEIADLIVTLIRGGAPVGPSFIPDGSVGIQWGKHWTDGDFDGHFGTRIKYEHEYPPNFPQSASNPQHVWCYPDASLPEFRRWAREHYIPNCLPGYLGGKEKQGLLPPSFTQLAIAAIQARKDMPQINE